MGYRSDVRIRTTKEGYEIMKEEIDKYLNEKVEDNLDYTPENLVKHTDNIDDDGEVVTMDWNYVKWYDFFPEIMAVSNALGILQEKDIDFQFMRIGEDLDDIEEKWSINNDSFDSFYVSRNFEG
jgi:hypothetical protein